MKKITMLLCLLWMGFIFYMSSNNGAISHLQSAKVVNIIENTQSRLETKASDKSTNETSQGSKNVNEEKLIKENSLNHVIRKNAHGFMYMVLAFLVSSAFFAYNKCGKNIIVHILFICLFYAVTDEFHQSFVPGRTSLVNDVLVDFLGTVIGVAFFYLFYYKVYTRKLIRKK